MLVQCAAHCLNCLRPLFPSNSGVQSLSCSMTRLRAFLSSRSGGAVMSKKGKSGIRSFHSKLNAHKREGKQLIAPLMTLKNTSTLSWLNDRLPELIWAALILEGCAREKGLEVFRRFCILCHEYEQQAEGSNLDWAPTLTGLAELPAGITNYVVVALDNAGVSRELLSPLLLFEGLPARARWLDLVPALHVEKVADAWQKLAIATADVLDHQSQPSTDIRWMTIMFKVMLGKVHFRAGADDEFVEELRLYPAKGDMRSVRPRIRAMEMAFRGGYDGTKAGPTEWCNHFWKECLEKTDCMPIPPATPVDWQVDRKPLIENLDEARRALLDHWAGTLTTSGLNPRHDATFALAFYALACLSELCVGPLSRVITGRLLVRTLTEIRINLAFLVKAGDEALWARFRSYGSGQAKLALLKYEDAEQGQPSLVSAETLEALANEDFFQEFVNIDLGSWSGADLRKMSEQCGVKDDYDRYYGWTSAFVHGQWAAVRDAVMATCGNPLHRAHRGPMSVQRPMESCIPDAVLLVNSILASVDECYPSLKFRLTVQDAARPAEAEESE